MVGRLECVGGSAAHNGFHRAFEDAWPRQHIYLMDDLADSDEFSSLFLVLLVLIWISEWHFVRTAIYKTLRRDVNSGMEIY